MTLTARPSQSAATRSRVTSHAKRGGALRHACAQFWLTTMFFLSRRAPLAVRGLRGVGIWSTWNFSRQVQDATITNARHLLGAGASMAQRRDLGRRIVGNFYDFIHDIGRTRGMSRQQLESLVASVEGADAYHQVRSEGKGAILATAHMGSFELGLSGILAVEKRIHVVFQRDGNSLFERLRSEFRHRLGILEAAVDDGWGMWMRLRDALAVNEVVAMQADRAMPGQVGVKVPFLDGHALFPEGPAKLAAITGAPIVPVFVIRLPDGRVTIHIERAIRVDSTSEVAINAAIGKLAQVIGSYVQAHPEQWLVLQRAWCEDMAETSGD